MAGGVAEGAVVTVEYRLACSGTAHLADGVHAGTDINAWQSGVELESSAAQRRPLTFEVGSRMALPLLDHAVRRLAVGDETGVPGGSGARRWRMLCSPSATLSLGWSCVLVLSGPSSHIWSVPQPCLAQLATSWAPNGAPRTASHWKRASALRSA